MCLLWKWTRAAKVNTKDEHRDVSCLSAVSSSWRRNSLRVAALSLPAFLHQASPGLRRISERYSPLEFC